MPSMSSVRLVVVWSCAALCLSPGACRKDTDSADRSASRDGAETAGGDWLLPPGTLALHILAEPSAGAPANTERLVVACAAGGPHAASTNALGWYAVDSDAPRVVRDRGVLAEWQGGSYVLAHTDAEHSVDARIPCDVVRFEVQQQMPTSAELYLYLEPKSAEQVRAIIASAAGRMAGLFLFDRLVDAWPIESMRPERVGIVGPLARIRDLEERLRQVARLPSEEGF